MLINGKAANTINAEDRGLSYGDGLFETLAVRNGRPCLWARHMARLQRDCKRLAITEPDATLLKSELDQAIDQASDGVAKIIITRGVGPRGYRPSGQETPTRIISFTPSASRNTTKAPAILRVCDTRLASGSALSDIKHLNRLEQVMARLEWSDLAVDEGIMLDSAGNVIEGTQSNLFMVKNGALITPELSQAGVAGIMRALVADTAKELGIATHQLNFGLNELWSADAVFLTSSLIGIWPVSQIDGQKYSVDAIPLELLARINCEAFRA